MATAKFYKFYGILSVTRDQIANIHLVMEKGREFQKNIYFCFINYAKAFDCVDHNKLFKILKEMGIPDHMTCLLRNLYAGQEATRRTGLSQETKGKKIKSIKLEIKMERSQQTTHKYKGS